MLKPELLTEALKSAHDACDPTNGKCMAVEAGATTLDNLELILKGIMCAEDAFGVALHFLHVGYRLAHLELGTITQSNQV